MDESIFTDHVRALLSGKPVAGDQIVRHLKDVVTKKLRRLGYWKSPPSYLRLEGDSWNDSTALDDLSQETYIACISSGLSRLAELLQASGTVEGAVHQKIEWYLKQRKRDGNPLGYRVFLNVKAASEALVELRVATAAPDCELNNDSVILGIGKSHPNSESELEEIFTDSLQDAEFVKAIVKKCLPSLRLTQKTIRSKFSSGLAGYVIRGLVALFSDETKLGREVSLVSGDDQDNSEKLSDLLPDFGTPSPDARYLELEEFEVLVKELRQRAETSITKQRIRDRVLNSLDVLGDLIREGEDIRELSLRRLADRLGVAKTTLATDFSRLRSSDGDHADAGAES